MSSATNDDRPLSVLLIEDNPGDARLFEELLSEGELEARCTWRSSLADGIEAMEDDPPDIVAVDLTLPDSEGLETVRRAAGAMPDIPLVVTTGLDDLDVATEALDAGAAEYLRKDGLTPALLSRTLRMAVERHRLEREADRQRRLSRSILESLPEHIAVLDEEGRILTTNESWRAFADTEGGDPRGYVGESYLEETEQAAARGSLDAKRMLEGLRAVLRGERDHFAMEYPCHSPEEKWWFRVEVVPLTAEDRSGVVVSHINITDRKLAEREIERRGRRFEALITNISDVVSVIGPEGTIHYSSPSVERVFGYAPEELADESVLTYFHPDDRGHIRDALTEATDGSGRDRIAEGRFRHSEGTWRVVEARGRTPPEGTDIQGVIVVTRDITSRVRRENRLEKATDALRERVKEQSCLYDVSQFLHADDRAFSARLQDVVDRLPDGWLFPEVTAARLELEGESWCTEGFRETVRMLSSSVDVDGERVGRVEVCYLEARPERDLGPFLDEERDLLEAISGQVAVAVDRVRTRRQLETERERLAEVFENAPSWIASFRGTDHVFEMANPAFRELAGGREVEGRTVREVFPELEGQGYIEFMDHVYETGEAVEIEERPLVLDHDDGQGPTRIYLTAIAQPRWEDGEVAGVITQGVDATEQVQKREEVREAEEKWSTALDLAPIGIAISHPETAEYFSVNQACAELLDRSPEEMVGRTAHDIGFWHDSDRRDEFLARLREQGAVRNEQMQFETATGKVREGRLSVNALELAGEERLIWTLQDVTEERAQAEALRQSEARYRTLVETMAEATTILDREGQIVFANEAAEELLGLEKVEVEARTYDDPSWTITAPDGGPFPAERLPFRRVMETGRAVRNVEHGIERPEGERRILSINAAPLQSGEGELEGVVATMRDVTERKRMEDELRHRALHDPLTELANRSLFEDRLSQALARARRRNQGVGVLILDLNRFKQLNDHFGHAAGDRVLKEVARRMEDAVRAEDTVARLGGDEFAVVAPEVHGLEELEAVRNRLSETLLRSFRVGGTDVEIDVTVGGVLAAERGHPEAVQPDEPDDVLRYADLALYRAKEQAGPAFHLYRQDEDDDRARQLTREQALRRAIREEHFEIHFQPIVRLQGTDAWGVEPLARWKHPDRGLVAPVEFIPLAEETGLIHELGELLFRKTCRHVASWPDALRDSITVTPNLSGRQFEREDLVPTLVSIARDHDIDPNRIAFEVTESAVTRATGRVQTLREEDFGVVVDDFGTGFSSFHYLRDLEFDGLKIDMSFIHGIERAGTNRALVETMITMGRAMGLRVIAEGIETEEQRAILAEMGCPLAQGFLFARPMRVGEITEFFSNSRNGDSAR